MIEQIKQETVNVLTDILLTGLETGRPRPIVLDKPVSRKYCLQLIRTYQQEHQEILPEVVQEAKEAYQEISGLTDREFELLYQELLTVRV